MAVSIRSVAIREPRHVRVSDAIQAVALPGLGRAYVATRPIRVGELLLEETPFFVARGIEVASADAARSDWAPSRFLSMRSPELGLGLSLDLHMPLLCFSFRASRRHTPRLDNLELTTTGAPPRPAGSFLCGRPRFLCAATILADPHARAALSSLYPRAADGDELPPEYANLAEEAGYARELLIRHNRAAFLRGVPPSDFTRACAEVDLNAFATKRDMDKGLALYERASLFNHDCWPNCRWSQSPGEAICVRAAREIAPGEPATIQYQSSYAPRVRRQRSLRKALLFSCGCARCRREEEEEGKDEERARAGEGAGADPGAAGQARGPGEDGRRAPFEAFRTAAAAAGTGPPGTRPERALAAWRALRADATASREPRVSWLWHEARLRLMAAILPAVLEDRSPARSSSPSSAPAAAAAAALADVGREEIEAQAAACPFVDPEVVDAYLLGADAAGGPLEGKEGGTGSDEFREAQRRYLHAVKYTPRERGALFYPSGLPDRLAEDPNATGGTAPSASTGAGSGAGGGTGTSRSAKARARRKAKGAEGSGAAPGADVCSNGHSGYIKGIDS
eukprot:tig00020564_g11437.t1